MIRTCWPGWIPPALSPCSAVTVGQRHGGGLLEGEIPRLGRGAVLADSYVLGEGAVAETVHLIARLERGDGAAGPLRRSGEVPARDRELRFADAPQPRSAEQERLAADEVPVPRIGRAGTHRHQHVLRAGDRHLHLGQVQDILWRPVPVPDDRLHGVLPRGPCPRIPRR
jgi:hypothetical protein